MDYDLAILLYSEQRLQNVAKVARTIRSVSVPRRTLLILNSPTLDRATVRRVFADHKKAEIIRHDNSGLEFGGYQAAINKLGGSVSPRLVIMNDTLGTHEVATRAYLDAFMRQTAMDEEKLVVGMIDKTERAISLGGLQSVRWIRSNLFGMDRAALYAAGCQLYHPEIDRLITASPDPDAFFGPLVRGTLRAHVSQWLFSTSGHHWYGSEPLSSANCEKMAGKARAILQEKYLSLTWEAAEVLFRQPYMTRAGLLAHKAEKALRFFRSGFQRTSYKAGAEDDYSVNTSSLMTSR